jgi:hypothetical protein
MEVTPMRYQHAIIVKHFTHLNWFLLVLLLALLPACGEESGLTSDDPESPADAGSDITESDSTTEDIPSADVAEEDTGTEVPDLSVPDEGADVSEDIHLPDIPIIDAVEGDEGSTPIEDVMTIVSLIPDRGSSDGGTELLVIGINFTLW